MPTTRFRRQFSAGSRPAPDPYDKYLDIEGFYRKHTARDASCLFRAISEQMFDTQEYHQRIRKDCVNFMIKHRDQYESVIPTDFDEYICQMSKLKTYGTFTELRAMGYMFKRNILLYQPFDLGMWLIKENEYTDQCFRIFFAPEKHFDSVFTKPFIVKAAFCQSICYEILYKNVFKLPDVEYSVETMLHDVNGHESNVDKGYGYDENYANHIVLDDGRKFQLDKPENTLCILDNLLLCHFHNPDFEVISEELENCSNPNDIFNLQRMISASLPEKYTSCVRQLLNEGITPFPYKVAKALDPDIYRNIEFDSWSDFRKEARSKAWYMGGSNFQVGVKCLVKLDESQEDFFKCHIQEMSPNNGPCIVFVEELAEKHSVPYSCLQPLNDAKPWALPYRYNHNRTSYESYQRNSLRQDKKHFANVNRFKIADTVSDYINCANDIDSRYRSVDKVYDLEQYTDFSHFQPYSFDIVAMPLAYCRSNSNNNNSGGPNNNNKPSNNRANAQSNQQCEKPAQQQPQQQQPQQQQSLTKIDEEKEFQANAVDQQQQQQQQQHQQQQQQLQIQTHQTQDQPFDMSVPPPPLPYFANNGSLVQYYYPNQDCAEQNYYSVSPDMMPPQTIYSVPPTSYPTTPIALPPPNSYNATIPGNQMYTTMPMNGWPAFNPAINAGGYYMPASSNPSLAITIPGMLPALPIRNRELVQLHGRVNLQAASSLSSNGADLPLNDKHTIRFFYNMGIEFFKNLQATYGTGPLIAMIEGADNNYNSDGSPTEPDRSEIIQNQISSDFQQLNFESNEMGNQTPHKTKANESYYNGPNSQNRRSNPNSKYRKDNKSNHNNPHLRNHSSYQYQGTTNQQKSIVNKSGSKHYNNNHNANNSSTNYEHTPVKDPNNKAHHYYDANNQGNSKIGTKRDNSYATPELQNSTSGYPTYVAQYMSYVPVDGNEHPPMMPYMPLNVYSPPGYPMVQPPPPQSIVRGTAAASPCDPESAEAYNAGYYNQTPYIYQPNFWCPPPLPPQPNNVAVQPQSLNSSNISSTSSNANSATNSNPSQ